MKVDISVPEVSVKVSAPKVTAETGTPVAREWVEREAYAGPYTVTPSESAQTLDTDGKRMTDDMEIGAISSSYVGSGITRRSSTDLSASGGTVTAPAGYYSEAASKSVQSGTEGTPSATKGTVSNHSVNVTPSVTNAAGYIAGGTHTGTAVTVTAAELESGTLEITENGDGIDVTGYAAVDVAVSDSVFVVTIVWDDDEEMWAPDKTYDEIYEAYSNQIPLEVVPDPSYSYVIGEQLVQGHYESRLDSFMYTVFDGATETTYLYNEESGITVLNSRDLYDTSDATISGNGQLLSGVKAVGADGTVYTGNIPSKQSSDLTASGATVTVPAGHYASQASKAVASGTAGTPTAAKSAVSNHAVTVTPSVTNTEGYISGGTKTGTGVQVTAAELESGTKTITQAGVTDVTNYATATVPSATPSYIGCTTGFFTENNVRKWKYTPRVEVDPWDGGNAGWLDEGEIYGSPVPYNAIATNTAITPSTSPQTIGGANYMMEGPVTIAAMPSGTAGTPTATKGTVSNHSVTITPSVTNTTGYITGGTKTGTAVTVSAAELESGTKSITQNGTGIDVTGYSAVDVAVPSGGSSKAFQIDNSNHRVNTTGYTNTGAYLKVTKAGKYDIYWSAFRSSTSSGTNGTRWYKNGVAQGSAYTTWANGYCQNPHVSGVTLAVNDEIEIYARASSTSRYCCVENLMIIEVD